MKLSPSQKQACQALQDVLVGLPQTSKADDGLWSLMDGDTSALFEDDELDSLDDEEYEDLDESQHEHMELQTNLVDNPVQHCVLDLLVSLFSHLPSGLDDTFYSPILRFVTLFSLKKNGQWLAGRHITQVFAALLFCGWVVMMAVMRNEVIQSSGMRYSE